MQTMELSSQVQACLTDLMHQLDTPASDPPVPLPTATSPAQPRDSKPQHLPRRRGSQQQSKQYLAAEASTSRSTQSEMHTADASGVVRPRHDRALAAGVPTIQEGTLRVLCVDGLLAGLANTKAWSAADREAYELCLHWSHQHVSAWMDRQDRAAPSQHALHNYPVLEPHAAICKSSRVGVQLLCGSCTA